MMTKHILSGERHIIMHNNCSRISTKPWGWTHVAGEIVFYRLLNQRTRSFKSQNLITNIFLPRFLEKFCCLLLLLLVFDTVVSFLKTSLGPFVGPIGWSVAVSKFFRCDEMRLWHYVYHGSSKHWLRYDNCEKNRDVITAKYKPWYYRFLRYPKVIYHWAPTSFVISHLAWLLWRGKTHMVVAWRIQNSEIPT